MKIAIIGSGSWGCALGIYLSQLVETVSVWSYLEEERDIINNEKRCKYLDGVKIPDNLKASTDFKEVIEDAEIILHVTPSQSVRTTIKEYKEYINTDQILIMCSKGFEKDSLKTFDDVIEEELPGVRYGFLLGPSHAEEVSKNILTALVIVSKDKDIREYVMNSFSSPTLRIYSSSDVKGAELGAGLKNIISFCAGITTGLELGDNIYAALVTRGLAEIVRLGTALGGKEKTFYGLTGLGDLIVTSESKYSRNRKAGILIAKGYTVDEAKKEIGMVVESIDNIDVAYKLAKKYGIKMSIIEAVYDILHNGLDPKEAVNMLMTQELKEED